MSRLEIPNNPSTRSAWLSYQLKLRGSSLSDLAREVGVSRYSIGRVMNQSSARIERIVADALGLKPRQLFPERYDRRGRRLIRTRELYRERRHASEAKGE